MGTKKYDGISGYRKYKLRVLERDFCVHITPEERSYAETLVTTTQIDQFCIGMLNKYWG